MQNEMESVMKNTLKQVEDILCRTNQAEPAACSVATSGRANKCANVFETMVMNMKGHAGNVRQYLLKYITVFQVKVRWYALWSGT